MKNVKLELVQDDNLEQVYGGGTYWETVTGVLTAFGVVGAVKFGYDVVNQSAYSCKNKGQSVYNDLVDKGAKNFNSVKNKVKKVWDLFEKD